MKYVMYELNIYYILYTCINTIITTFIFAFVIIFDSHFRFIVEHLVVSRFVTTTVIRNSTSVLQNCQTKEIYVRSSHTIHNFHLIES